MKATERMINSVWTVEYEIVSEGKVKILAYNRDDEEGYKREKELPRCKVIEDRVRNVKGLRISPVQPFSYMSIEQDDNSEYFEVVNVQHIFSYSK
jgi:hypothetical protein